MHSSSNVDPICSSLELSCISGAKSRQGCAGEGAGPGGCVILPLEQFKQDLARSKAARTVEPCVAYMMQHLDQPLRVATLSALIKHSSSHFFSVFKCATGLAPIRFFIRARMHRACWLLKETTLSVKEIAALLGYDDAFYFSRLFKSINGVAPREYRATPAESRRTQGDASRDPFEGAIGEVLRTQQLPTSPSGVNGRSNGFTNRAAMATHPRMYLELVNPSRRATQTSQTPFTHNSHSNP